MEPPTGEKACQQKCWDSLLVDGCFTSLLSSASPQGRVRLLASEQKEVGAWLSAPPVSALGLRMSDESICIVVGLRIGAPLCTPHSCSLCGSQVDASGVHGLSCRRSQGRLRRHAALNDIVHHTTPATLEPRGLCRSDGRRPDGLTITPRSNGRALVWDTTCWDSFAPFHIHMSSARAGKLADHAADRKRETYRDLIPL